VSHTIGAVAAATGVTVDTLRAWELRYGFPTPERLRGGHRRYDDADVARIHAVQAARAAGLSLEAAIGRARSQDDPGDASVFSALRRRWPNQPVQLLSRRSMLAISRAIEDETCARADRPVLIGCFQREQYYRQSERRWRELARTARWAAAFADFPVTAQRAAGPVEVAIAPDGPLAREWGVICDGRHASACVVAVERLGTGDASQRLFEAIWSIDPELVRDAARIALALAGPVAGALDETSAHADASAVFINATALLARTIAYLET
jgi:DICT domain-containing protein